MAGVWKGSAEGYGGPITVSVETDASSILDIRVIEHHEDPFIGGEALRELIDAVLEEDSTDVDAISGASITSTGFLEAVDNALISAKLAPVAAATADVIKIEPVQTKVSIIEAVTSDDNIAAAQALNEVSDLNVDIADIEIASIEIASNEIARNDDQQIKDEVTPSFAAAPVAAEQSPFPTPNEQKQQIPDVQDAPDKKNKDGFDYRISTCIFGILFLLSLFGKTANNTGKREIDDKINKRDKNENYENMSGGNGNFLRKAAHQYFRIKEKFRYGKLSKK
ncbi:hypothetical protein FACS189494_05300 [Spirochaetia bacterium]|nr:hypothetical protein FACS189494_05300 [Spirochaetia bacterium]